MSTTELRVCTNNRDRFALPISVWEQNSCAVEIVECLAQCGDCEVCPFVERDGSFLFADSVEELQASLSQAPS